MARTLTIGKIVIGDGTDAFTVAEIGHNGQGSVELTKQLIKTAADAGFSSVKLQKRTNHQLYTRAYYNQPYTSDGAFGPTYGEHREALEFNKFDYLELKGYADALGILFFATAFDPDAADFLATLGVPAFKVASGDITNTPLLGYLASFDIPLIISTGTANLEDVDRAVETVTKHHDRFAILQCTAVYPAEPSKLNLRVIETYRNRYPTTVIGLSSHAPCLWDATVGYTLGARVIEKHVTLSRCMKGSDHVFSLEPAGQRALIEELRTTRLALGDGVKRQRPEEVAALSKMGKSIVAARPLPAGHVLAVDDMAIKSPGGGIPPYRFFELVGRQIPAALETDDLIPELRPMAVGA